MSLQEAATIVGLVTKSILVGVTAATLIISCRGTRYKKLIMMETLLLVSNVG